MAKALSFNRVAIHATLIVACAVYLGAVVCLGRVNEYRLFLPFIPMLLVVDRERFERSGPAEAEARPAPIGTPASAG